MIFGFFSDEELILVYVINTKMSNFACKFFIRKIYILTQQQVCSQKRDKNFLPQIFIFVYEKNAYHTIFIYGYQISGIIESHLHCFY